MGVGPLAGGAACILGIRAGFRPEGSLDTHQSLNPKEPS